MVIENDTQVYESWHDIEPLERCVYVAIYDYYRFKAQLPVQTSYDRAKKHGKRAVLDFRASEKRKISIPVFKAAQVQLVTN